MKRLLTIVLSTALILTGCGGSKTKDLVDAVKDGDPNKVVDAVKNGAEDDKLKEEDKKNKEFQAFINEIKNSKLESNLLINRVQSGDDVFCFEKSQTNNSNDIIKFDKNFEKRTVFFSVNNDISTIYDDSLSLIGTKLFFKSNKGLTWLDINDTKKYGFFDSKSLNEKTKLYVANNDYVYYFKKPYSVIGQADGDLKLYRANIIGNNEEELLPAYFNEIRDTTTTAPKMVHLYGNKLIFPSSTYKNYDELQKLLSADKFSTNKASVAIGKNNLDPPKEFIDEVKKKDDYKEDGTANFYINHYLLYELDLSTNKCSIIAQDVTDYTGIYPVQDKYYLHCSGISYVGTYNIKKGGKASESSLTENFFFKQLNPDTLTFEENSYFKGLAVVEATYNYKNKNVYAIAQYEKNKLQYRRIAECKNGAWAPVTNDLTSYHALKVSRGRTYFKHADELFMFTEDSKPQKTDNFK